MRKNFGAKPYTYPQPVFIVAAYCPDGTPDAMNRLGRHQRHHRADPVPERGAQDHPEHPGAQVVHRQHGRCRPCGGV